MVAKGALQTLLSVEEDPMLIIIYIKLCYILLQVGDKFKRKISID